MSLEEKNQGIEIVLEIFRECIKKSQKIKNYTIHPNDNFDNDTTTIMLLDRDREKSFKFNVTNEDLEDCVNDKKVRAELEKSIAQFINQNEL